VRVIVIEPGAVANHITHGETKQGVEQFYAATAITADDVAQIIAFAVSDRAACRSTRSSSDPRRKPSEERDTAPNASTRRG
jgi:NADP-dependent 3-hydroxy acid dehydrogenase YdfG